MKSIPTLILISMLLFFTAACSDDDTLNNPEEQGTACTEITFYADTDGDGLGDANVSQVACETETPDGFVTNADDTDDSVIIEDLISGTIENLFAPQMGGGPDPASGAFTKFNFETGMQTDSDTDWDIAFRATTIAVNGGIPTGTTDEPARNGEAGAAIATGTFDAITTANGLTFTQDNETSFAIPTGSDNGWYNYNFATNIVSPIPGKILVFKTRDGRYAKIEILSYYEDQDPSNEGRYFTFNYIYNPNEADTSLAL